MSTDQSSNGAPQSAANGDTAEKGQTLDAANGGQKETVSYDSYRKVVGAHKKLEEKFSTVEAELQKLREEKLSADGKKDELLTEYKRKYEDLDGKFKGAVGKFAMKTLMDAAEKEAIKAGCLNAKSLVKLMDLAEIEVNEDFDVDSDALKKAIERVKVENPFMFSKSAPQFKDVPKPGAGETKTEGLKGKSVNDLATMLAKMN